MQLAGPTTLIDNGFLLSNSFLLEHMTTGAYHSIMGKYIPDFSAKVNPAKLNGIFSTGGSPLWKIVQNLQISSGNILEHLLSEVGGSLNLRAGFLNNVNINTPINDLNHLLGNSLDISVKGYESNLYNIANEIQKIAKKASSIDIVYGGATSYFHLNIDPKRAMDTASKIELPVIRSLDLSDGTVLIGNQSLRGYV